MNKIICDICGTQYPETAEACPICGTSRDAAQSLLSDALAEEEITAAPVKKSGLFASKKAQRKLVEEEEDEDEDDDDIDEEDDDDDDDYEYDDDDDEDEEDDHKSNAPLVVLLIVVIAALLLASAFLFVKFFLPNMIPEDTAPATDPVSTVASTDETQAPTVPCDSLVMTSGGSVELTMEGANWLINVMALPENTTDVVTYTSSDETVATVSESGKITAVGEGTAVITITCGKESLVCNVTCNFSAVETTAPVDATEPEGTDPGAEETTAPTEPEETTEPTQPLKDITLKVIKYTDLTFNAPGQGFTFVLEGLKNNEVKWISQDENVVTVDENGTVLSVGKGNTTIICQYGDQKVEIKITCRW